MEHHRPIGITVLAGAGFVVGVWNLMGAMFALSYVSSMVVLAAWQGFPPEYAPAYAALGNVGWVLLAAAAATAVIVGSIGLWTLQPWAYWVTLIGAAVSLLIHVIPGLQGTVNGTSLISAGLALAIVIYMLLPSVRRAFVPLEREPELPPSQA